MKKFTVRDLAFIAVMTAAICVVAPFSIPIPVSPVPISLATFIVYLAVFFLGQKKAFVSVLVYLLLGLVGLPVFTGFSGGPAKLLGPTGGYAIGYLFIALISGWIVEKYAGKRVICFLGLVLGSVAMYALGTAWLGFQMHLSIPAALMAGVIPYLPGDFAKMIIAAVVGPQVQKQLRTLGSDFRKEPHTENNTV